MTASQSVFRLLGVPQNTSYPRFMRGANPKTDAFLPCGLLGKRVWICVSGERRGFVRAGRHMAAFCHTDLPTGRWPWRSPHRSDPSGSWSWVPSGPPVRTSRGGAWESRAEPSHRRPAASGREARGAQPSVPRRVRWNKSFFSLKVA